MTSFYQKFSQSSLLWDSEIRRSFFSRNPSDQESSRLRNRFDAPQ
jgi:hypothetical protein